MQLFFHFYELLNMRSKLCSRLLVLTVYLGLSLCTTWQSYDIISSNFIFFNYESSLDVPQLLILRRATTFNTPNNVVPLVFLVLKEIVCIIELYKFSMQISFLMLGHFHVTLSQLKFIMLGNEYVVSIGYGY